jgi:hypothetical protein
MTDFSSSVEQSENTSKAGVQPMAEKTSELDAKICVAATPTIEMSLRLIGMPNLPVSRLAFGALFGRQRRYR